MWHQSDKQLAYIVLGVTGLTRSGLVWRYGVDRVRPAWDQDAAAAFLVWPFLWIARRLPRSIVASAFALAGLTLIFATTSTGVGSVLLAIVHDGVRVVAVAYFALQWLGVVAFGVVFVTVLYAALFVREREVRTGSLIIVGIVAVLAVIYYFTVYRPDPTAFRVTPFHDWWDWLSR